MAVIQKKRQPNVALVINPAGGRLSGSKKIMTPAQKGAATRRRNLRAANAIKGGGLQKRNPRTPAKRVYVRKNPSSVGGLISAALFVGVGVALFDTVTNRVIPGQSPMVRIGIKAGGAYLFQSNMAKSIPVIGPYKNEIALVLATSAVVDAVKLWLLPIINNATGNLLIAPVELVDASQQQAYS